MLLASNSGRPIFTFEDSAALWADVVTYDTAVVPAPAYARAGGILRKLIRQARIRRADMDQRIVAGMQSAQAQQLTQDAEASQ